MKVLVLVFLSFLIQIQAVFYKFILRKKKDSLSHVSVVSVVVLHFGHKVVHKIHSRKKQQLGSAAAAGFDFFCVTAWVVNTQWKEFFLFCFLIYFL